MTLIVGEVPGRLLELVLLLVLRTSVATLSLAAAHADAAFLRQAIETIEYVRGRM